MHKLRIASRTSQLALAQSNIVKNKLLEHYPDLDIEIIATKTIGDKILDVSLAKIGGKGLFVKELENLLLENKADIAVHSMKDVPAELPDGLTLKTILEREVVNDAYISNNKTNFSRLNSNSIVGTSSLRRLTQLKKIRPDLQYKNLRGNVNTRLSKLDNGEFDAIILAECGLKRLNLGNRITEIINVDSVLPAAGQGALGIECRSTDLEILSMLEKINDINSYRIVQSERMVTKILNGGCQAPIAAYASLTKDNLLTLQAKVMDVESDYLITASDTFPAADFINLGTKVAKKLLEQGASELIENAKKYFNN